VVETTPTPPQSERGRWRRVAAGAAAALLVAGGAVAAALSLTGGDGSTDAASTGGGQTVATTSNAQNVSSEEDCHGLGTVVADVSVGAHADDLVPIALDISASDYVADRDFLADYAARAPADMLPDVMRLGRFLDRYASAAQAVAVEPGAVPTPDQVVEIRVAAQMGSVEQDQLPGSIEALRTWTGSGCSGGRPQIATTPVPTTQAATTEAATTEAVPVAAVEQIEAILEQSASGRSELGSAIAAGFNCSISTRAAGQRVDRVVANRQSLLAQLRSLQAPSQEVGEALRLLAVGLQHAIEADIYYREGFFSISTSGCPLPTNANFTRARESDVLATAAKQRFVAVFNPLAGRAGLRTWSANEI
jgi:hypothetical protein